MFILVLIVGMDWGTGERDQGNGGDEKGGYKMNLKCFPKVMKPCSPKNIIL